MGEEALIQVCSLVGQFAAAYYSLLFLVAMPPWREYDSSDKGSWQSDSWKDGSSNSNAWQSHDGPWMYTNEQAAEGWGVRPPQGPKHPISWLGGRNSSGLAGRSNSWLASHSNSWLACNCNSWNARFVPGQFQGTSQWHGTTKVCTRPATKRATMRRARTGKKAPKRGRYNCTRCKRRCRAR